MDEEPIFVLDENTEDTCNSIIFILDNHQHNELDQKINRNLVALLSSYTNGNRTADRYLVANKDWLLDKLSEIYGEEAKRKLADGAAFIIYCTQERGKH